MQGKKKKIRKKNDKKRENLKTKLSFVASGIKYLKTFTSKLVLASNIKC